jgi:DNA-binding NarL/FixJ family response regulator
MQRASVILLTDRRDRSRALADAVRSVSACHVVGVGEPLFSFDPVVGVIADIDLDRPGAKQILTTLVDVRQEPRVPVIVLSRSSGDAASSRATRLGATACLPEVTEAATIVAALFRQIRSQSDDGQRSGGAATLVYGLPELVGLEGGPL